MGSASGLHLGIREQLSDAADAPTGFAFLHRVHPVFEQPPESRSAVRAGEPAGHADNRNRWFGPGGLRFASFGTDGPPEGAGGSIG